MLSAAFGVQITFILEWITFFSEAAPNSLLPPVQEGSIFTSCVIFDKWLGLSEAYFSHLLNGKECLILLLLTLAGALQAQYSY